MAKTQSEFEAPLSHLCSLPFVQNLRFLPVKNAADRGSDGMIEFTTPHGQYRLCVEMKNLISTRASRTRSLAAHADGHSMSTRRSAGKFGRENGKLVLARYIRATVGEQFVKPAADTQQEAIGCFRTRCLKPNFPSSTWPTHFFWASICVDWPRIRYFY